MFLFIHLYFFYQVTYCCYQAHVESVSPDLCINIYRILLNYNVLYPHSSVTVLFYLFIYM